MKIVALLSCGTDDCYHSPLVQSFIDRCNENDCRVLWFQSISSSNDDSPHTRGERNIFRLINHELIDAVVLMSLTFFDKNLLRQIVDTANKHNIPIISIDGHIDGAYNIYLGYTDALEKMVRHVITEHGARNIKFLSGDKENEESLARESVFRKVMAEYNLEITDDNIDYCFFWWSEAADAVQRHYEKHGSMPDAFVCANDSMAIGVCGKLTELGFRVPEDVIVTGIDGIPEGNSYSPSITTLMLDINSAGKTAADRTAQILNGTIPAVGNETVAGALLYRESCGCEPARHSVDDNALKHDLYNKIDLWSSVANGFILMAEAVTNSGSFEDTLENIKPFLSWAWTRECWLCICDDYLSNSAEDAAASAENYRKSGYSKTMKHVVHGVNDSEFDILDAFESSELVPDLKNVLEKYKNLMFLPLNFGDRAIGYFALEFTNAIRNYHILHSFLSNISRVLENSRIQTELKSVVNRLENMYIHDSMTSLYNRRGFYRLVPSIYNRCRDEQTEFMVLSVDMDNLKGINDTYGHSEGDNALTTIAKALLEASSGNEIVARFGGDEYIVAGKSISDNYVETFIGKFRDFLDEYNKTSGKPYNVEASCGVYSLVPPKNTSLDEFIKTADQLMYDEKATHRMHGYSRGRM